MPSVKPAPTGEVTPRRLHISGIHSSVKPLELINRFSSFGTILGGEDGVAGLGLDANGTPRKFAFITLETTDQQLAKCTSMLNGSLWKGHKLRIALAKPDYHARAEAERVAPVVPPKPVKRKLSNTEGIQARHFELVNAANYKRHRGWILDAPAPTPLFPLLTRPPHALPALPVAAPTSWTRAKPSKAARLALRSGGPSVLPLTRAQRVRIDVRRWGRSKVVFPEPAPGSAGWSGNGGWECAESEKKGEEVVWVWKGRGGEVKREETVRLGKATAHVDQFRAMLERMVVPSAPVVEEVVVDASEGVVERRAKSASPPPYVGVAPRTLLFNEEDAFAMRAATQGEEEKEEARKAEKASQLAVLMGLLGEEDKVESTEVVPIRAVPMPAVEGFGEEDDDLEEVLRLRGGAGDEEEESDDEDVEMDTGDKPKTQLAMGTLKDMFKPQESTSFSLLAGLDLELEPLERTPSPPPQFFTPAPAQLHSQAFEKPAALGGRNRAWIGTGPLTPFFAFPSGSFEGPDGEVVGVVLEESGVGMDVALRAKEESARRIGDGAKSFWRSETIEMIEEEHQKLREGLRGQARKRHREASKRVRKKETNKRGTAGAGAGAEGGGE